MVQEAISIRPTSQTEIASFFSTVAYFSIRHRHCNYVFDPFNPEKNNTRKSNEELRGGAHRQFS